MKPRRTKTSKSVKHSRHQDGRYVVVFQKPDGSLHNPPVSMAARLMVVAIEPEDQPEPSPPARVTINEADELPGRLRVDPMPVFGGPAHLIADSTVGRSSAADTEPSHPGDRSSPTGEATPRMEATPDALAALKEAMDGLRQKASEPMTPERADRVMAANGIAPKPASQAPKAQATPGPREESWYDAAACLFYKGVCIFVVAGLCGAGLHVGWLTIKSIPSWLIDLILPR